MPFYIYDKNQEANQYYYKQVKKIPLAGKRSPFKAKVEDLKITLNSADVSLRWEIDSREMLNYCSYKNSNAGIVIDLKPDVKQNVSLYEIKKVWGFTKRTWTPLALKLYPLFQDKESQNVKRCKQEFKVEMETDYHIYEFLYLRGGLDGGPWTWGRIGSVNGVLLWPDTLEYFFAKINQDRHA